MGGETLGELCCNPKKQVLSSVGQQTQQGRFTQRKQMQQKTEEKRKVVLRNLSDRSFNKIRGIFPG